MMQCLALSFPSSNASHAIYTQAVFDFEWAQAQGAEQGALTEEFPVLCKPQPKVCFDLL